MEMLFTKEPVKHIYLPYAIMIYHRAVIHGKEKLRIMILYRKERPESSLARMLPSASFRLYAT